MILNQQTCCIRLFYNLFYNKMVSIVTKEWIIGSSLGWQNSSLQVAFATYNLTLLSTVEGPKTCSVSLPIETSLFQVPTSFETSWQLCHRWIKLCHTSSCHLPQRLIFSLVSGGKHMAEHNFTPFLNFLVNCLQHLQKEYLYLYESS